jgi:predicted HicB family RNase H-like nuclease
MAIATIIRIEEELHKRLKAEAYLSGESMNGLVAIALDEFLAKREKNRKGDK